MFLGPKKKDYSLVNHCSDRYLDSPDRIITLQKNKNKKWLPDVHFF